jgi:hypothetical protein
MRTLLFFILITLVSCSTGLPRKYRVFVSNGSGWGKSATYIDCDSATMISKTEAIIYIDGHTSHIYAEGILLSN